MPQFRFVAVTPNGKIAQGEFEADNARLAKSRISKLTAAKGLRLRSLDKKQIFNYKVQKPGRPVVTGEQEAYTREEVEKALLKLGYKVIKIERQLIQLPGRVPTKDVVTFIRLSADLLKQKLTYDEILTLLYEDTTNKTLKKTIRTIQKDLKDGKEGVEVYKKHEKVFGKFATYMLGVASTSGNMSLVFENTAKFLERDADFKKNLRRSLMMPAITFILVIGVILFYVAYIFPATARMFIKMNVTLPPMIDETLRFSNYLQAHWLIICLAFTLPIVAFVLFIRTTKGRLWLDRNIIKIPVMGDLMHKTSIEIFARVFYTLYSGSGQNIEVIKIGSEACRNKYMEKQIKTIAIPMMLKEGRGLVESFEATGIFTHTAMSRFKLGAESGAIKENSRQLAEYYEIQTTYKMEAVVDLINLFVNLFIMVALTAITIVSSEMALIHPNVTAMMKH